MKAHIEIDMDGPEFGLSTQDPRMQDTLSRVLRNALNWIDSYGVPEDGTEVALKTGLTRVGTLKIVSAPTPERSPEFKERCRQVAEAQANDTRTLEQKIEAAADFVANSTLGDCPRGCPKCAPAPTPQGEAELPPLLIVQRVSGAGLIASVSAPAITHGPTAAYVRKDTILPPDTYCEHGEPQQLCQHPAPPPPATGEVASKPMPCAGCGGPHRFDTSVPSVQWNAVVRPTGIPEYLCTSCILRLFVLAGRSFTATLWGSELPGVPVEFRVREQVANDAHAIGEQNNTLRAALSLIIDHARVTLDSATAPAPPVPTCTPQHVEAARRMDALFEEVEPEPAGAGDGDPVFDDPPTTPSTGAGLEAALVEVTATLRWLYDYTTRQARCALPIGSADVLKIADKAESALAAGRSTR